MTTETIKELHYKVCEAVGEVLTDYYHQNDGDNQKRICASEDITKAALEAVGFDDLLEERKAMREALRWYGVQVRRIGNDFLNQDNQSLLVGIKDITVDFGKRAKTALKEQPQ